MKHKLIGAIMAAMAFIVAAPVHAQYGILPSVIGSTIGRMAASQHEIECLTGGGAPNGDEIASARTGVITAMSRYLVLAKPSPANTTAAFMKKASMREWSLDGVSAKVGANDDPLARSLGTATLGAPDDFFRASDGRGALAIWRVPGTGSAPIGHYRGFFRTEGGLWKLRKLEITTGAAALAPITQFCHSPGDIEEYRVIVAENDAKKARKKAEKAKREAARRK